MPIPITCEDAWGGMPANWNNTRKVKYFTTSMGEKPVAQSKSITCRW